MKVSVIVATRDRPDDLQRCLASLARLDPPASEVIVADQSVDPREWASMPIQHLILATAGKANALNAALRAASGQIVALTDDDCEVPPDWLTRIGEVFDRHPEGGIVCGALKAAQHDEAATYVPQFQPPRFRVRRGRLVRAHRMGVGANMAVRREVFDKAGTFDAYHGPGSLYRSGDDWEFAYRALKAGVGVIQDPQSVVVHHGQRDYASGAPRRLISSNYHGIGAGYARHLRSGDVVAGYLLFQEILLILADVASKAIRMSRPVGVRRLAFLLVGMWRGIRSPHSVVRRSPVQPETEAPRSPQEVATGE